jgi:hypothetical protein
MNYVRPFYTMPINSSGTKAGIAYSWMKYSLGKELERNDLTGTATVVSGYLTHPVIRNLNNNLYASFSLGATGLNGTWTALSSNPTVSALAAGSKFGNAVALNTTSALVGANGVSGSQGDAFLYTIGSGAVTDLAATAGQPVTGLSSGASFGQSVALNSTYALVGASGVSGNRGNAYLYNLGSGAWTDLSTVYSQPITGLAAGSLFGTSVAMNDTYALVGAPGAGPATGGSAYVYDPANGVWTDLTSAATVQGLNASANFGSSVALNSNFMLIGAPGVSGSYRGNAYLVNVAQTTNSYITSEMIQAGLATGNYTVTADNSLTINRLTLTALNTGNALTLQSGGGHHHQHAGHARQPYGNAAGQCAERQPRQRHVAQGRSSRYHPQCRQFHR